MIVLPHTQEMVEEAFDWAEKLGQLNNSITKGKGNAAGRLGELALAKYLNVSVPSDKYNHDIVYGGETIEVKTKRRVVAPKDYYDVSVAETSRHQKPNKYAFISLQYEKSGYYGQPAKGMQRRGGKEYKNLQRVWYCGDMAHDAYWNRATKWERGKRDESNDFTTLVNMYNLRIDELDNSLTLEKDLDPFDL